MLFRVEAISLLHFCNISGAERGSVGDCLPCDRTTKTNDSPHIDESRTIASLRIMERTNNRRNVVTAVLHINHSPAARLHLLVDIFSVGNVNCPVASDLVVIVDDREVVELPMAGERDGLKSNAFLQASVADHTPDVV